MKETKFKCMFCNKTVTMQNGEILKGCSHYASKEIKSFNDLLNLFKDGKS